MSYGSGPNVRLSADLASVRAEVEKLKGDPSRLEEFHNDPEGFLRRLGIEIDANTLSGIRSQLEARRSAKTASAVQAGSIHVDLT